MDDGLMASTLDEEAILYTITDLFLNSLQDTHTYHLTVF